VTDTIWLSFPHLSKVAELQGRVRNAGCGGGSSWVIKIVNEVLGKEVIACDEPKRLQSAKKALEEIFEIRKLMKIPDEIIESKEGC